MVKIFYVEKELKNNSYGKLNSEVERAKEKRQGR